MKRPILTLALLLFLSPSAALFARATPGADVARYAGDQLTKRYPADGPGGAILVARGDTVLFRAARGQADVEHHVPLRPDSVFRLGSISKQFAAAGLLKLVEAGKVKLDDPLSKYVPDYPGGDRITVLHLLNHTSGVKSYTAIPGYMKELVRRDLTTAQMIDVFRNEAPAFEPGSQWSYSNSGYVLVGAIIEAASGQPWYAYLDRVLFKPLGMKHTGYGADPRLAAQQVQGYAYRGDDVVPAPPLSMTQAHAAGGLVSNADDLLKWNRALHEGRVLRSATYAQMIAPVGPAADAAIRYGFGIFNGRVRHDAVLWHGGEIFGFVSSLSYVPGPDITVVILENDQNQNMPKGSERADDLARRLAAVALGDPYPETRAVPVDVAALQPAEGVYRFEGDVTRMLRVIDGRLTAQRGSNGKPAVLTPIAADVFLYEDGFTRIELQRDARGKITGVRLFQHGDGDGETGVKAD